MMNINVMDYNNNKNIKIDENITNEDMNKNLNNDEALELAINSGANECESSNNYHEILCEKKDFYKVKNSVEKKISNLMYSGIEWRPRNYLKLPKEQKEKVIVMLENLDEIDDIQNIFTNCEL